MGWEVARAGTGGLSWRLGGCGLGCGAVEWCCLVNFFPAVNSLSAERGVEEWVSSSGKMANLMPRLE